jgi:alanine racemase
MDMVTVDLTEHPSAGIGSEVVFWGDSLPIDGVAQACATLAYELMTGVTERVHRRSIAALPADDHAHVHGGEDGEG